MGGFGYAPDLIERFPATTGGVIHALGVVNGVTPPDLVSDYREEQRRVKAEIDDTPLSEIPTVAAWRRTFREFGVDPTKHRSAIEALLRRLSKQGDIPSINAMVDMANLISIRHRLPVAVFDQRAVSGVTTVRFARGDETFTDLGSDGTSNPEPAEVIFVDGAGLVSARRWCWRQSAESAAGPDTSEVVITIEGQHETADAQVAAALDELMGLLGRHQSNAVCRSAMLQIGTPAFHF